MATCADDNDYGIDVGKIPIIDLRSFCQDEIRCVAKLSGDCSDERLADIVSVAIDKTVFNESLGSRRQTYARDRIPRRAQHLHRADAHSKPRLLASSEKQTNPGEQIQRSSSTDLKEKRSYRENQELIARICRQMQKPLLTVGDSSFGVCDAANQAGAGSHAKENAVLPAFKHVRTTIIAGGQLISVVEARRDDTHGQKRRHTSRTAHAEGHEGSTAGFDVAAGGAAKKLKVDNGRADSIRLKRIARGNLAADGAANGQVWKENSSPERSHRLSKKMKTKEEARKRAATRDAQTGLLDTVGLEQARPSGDGDSDHPSARREDTSSAARKAVDIKLMDAEGFPHGWKVCVALKRRKTGMTAKIIKFVSPDGQEWFSHKEALRHAGSVVGVNGSSQIGSGLKPSEPGLALFGDPNLHKTDASKVLAQRSAATIIRLNKSHAPRHALCTTCGKTFTTQYSLRRHANSQGHKPDQSSGAGADHNSHREVKGQLSSKRDLKVQHHHGLTKANGNEQQETGISLEGKLGTGKGNIDNTDMEMHKCKTCKKLFNSRNKYRAHLRIHSLKCPRRGKTRAFECRQCNSRFKRRRQYVEHLKTHSRKGKKKAGRLSNRKAGRPVSRPSVKVTDKSVQKMPKSKRVGQSSAASSEKKISFPENKDIGKALKQKSPKQKFLCDKCGAVFGHRIACLGHQSVHAKEKIKRKHGQKGYGRREKFHEEGFDGQATLENVSTFPCQFCGKVFKEYFRYSGHLSVHSSKRRKTEYHGLPAVASREKQNSSSSGAVNCDHDYENSFFSQESLTSVLRKLLSDTTGTCLPGLPAKLLFARNLDAFELEKETKPREKVRALAGAYHGGVCSTSQVDFSQGGSIMDEGSKLTNNRLPVGWNVGGCSICGNIGADNAQTVVCDWCDREFHESCLTQQCRGLSASWVCPSCRATSRSLQK